MMQTVPGRGAAAAVPLFAAAVTFGAWQLFLVQPMAAKILLPHLGGTPAVWNTCMLVFQVLLLVGYLYAHLVTLRLSARAQAVVHGTVLALPLLALPVGLASGWTDPGSGSPIAWTIGALVMGFGAPFAVLATTAPLLQRWFAATGHPRAHDPYFLYAASNAGSLGALAAYPLLVEPLFGLDRQQVLWSAGYVVWALLVAACAWTSYRARAQFAEGEVASAEPVKGSPPITWKRIGWWVLLAFAPSSLVLGATQYMTTDIAVFPLLWVVPLAAYLLSFVLAFSQRRVGSPKAWGYVLAPLTAAAALSFWAFNRPWVWLVVLLHPLIVFTAGMVAHGRLASERPAPERLTTFYLAIAVGGALGGLFNALIAPLLFPIIIEYPIVMVLACLLRPTPETPFAARKRGRALDLVLPAGLALAAFALVKVAMAMASQDPITVIVVQAVVPCVILLTFLRRPLRFALGLAVLLGVGGFQTAISGRVVHVERTFYGVHRIFERTGPDFVETAADGSTHVFAVPFRVLYHGGTRHGMQALDPRFRAIPGSYYHRSGPIGEVFAKCGSSGRLSRVAAIGLGVGTLAAYAEPGRSFTFFELDPAVVRIARDSSLFTFVSEYAPAARFVVGDGRLGLAREPAASFDLVVVDAFSSDAIPVHLLTREAFQIYFERLTPDGLLALHLTNQNLDLSPVVDAVAASLGLHGLALDDEVGTPQELLEGKDASSWIVLARHETALAPLRDDPRWKAVPAKPRASPDSSFLWTDDYSNIVSVIHAH